MLELLEPDQALLSRRKEIAAALAAIVPDGTISDEATLTAYDGDALTAYRQTPLVCVLPRSTDEVAAARRGHFALRRRPARRRRHSARPCPHEPNSRSGL